MSYFFQLKLTYMVTDAEFRKILRNTKKILAFFSITWRKIDVEYQCNGGFLPHQPQHVKHIPLPHPSDNSNMEKNERGSALVSSLLCTVLSHTLTVMAADGYAVEFTLPGFSTCICHKPKPSVFYHSVLLSVHSFLVLGRDFLSVCIYHVVKFREESQDD